MSGRTVLFLKARIKGGAVGDLFDQKVTVHSHTTREGTFVQEHQATRHKAPVKPAMSDAEADSFADQAFAAHHKWRKEYGKNPPMKSHASILGAWHADSGRGELSYDDEGAILAGMKRHVDRANAAPAAPATVPEGVKRDVKRHLDWLHATHREVSDMASTDGDDMAGELLAQHTEAIATKRAKLAQFRELATSKGIDHAAVIAELGGEPDMGTAVAEGAAKMRARLDAEQAKRRGYADKNAADLQAMAVTPPPAVAVREVPAAAKVAPVAQAPKWLRIPKTSLGTMTSGAILAERDRVDAIHNDLLREMIAAGRGGEKGAETRAMTDPLAVRCNEVSDRRSAVNDEIAARKRYHGGTKPIRRPS